VPKTPLFEVIAAEIVAMVGERGSTIASTDAAKTAAVAVHLRQMWNARGAADIAKLETAIPNAGRRPNRLAHSRVRCARWTRRYVPLAFTVRDPFCANRHSLKTRPPYKRYLTVMWSARYDVAARRDLCVTA
jgi:hypothetical protein